MPATAVKSAWSGGDLYFYDKSGNEIFHVDGTNRKLVVPSGSALDLSALNQGKGFIPLPLAAAREIATNDYVNTAGDAGVLSGNTTPILQRVNGATDKKARINWASGNSDEIVWDIVYPPDLDDTAAVTINFLAGMSGSTNTPVLTVSYFEGVGDTNAGGTTAALAAAVAKVSVTIAASDIGPYPAAASIGVVPGTHGTDAVYLYGAWVEYTKKTA